MLDELLERAESGDQYALNELGNCYLYGIGVSKNKYQAARWYRLAAQQGNANAQCMYATGEGVVKDDKEAARLWSMAAKQGHAKSQCNLGVCYYYGAGVIKDVGEAVNIIILLQNNEML